MADDPEALKMHTIKLHGPVGGGLVAWLTGQEKTKTKAKTESGQQIFRRLANKYHPDREKGNAEVMSDLNQLWGSVKQLSTGGTQ